MLVLSRKLGERRCEVSKVPVPPADRSLPAGQQYAEWLAAVRELDPTITPDDPKGEPPIPMDGYSFYENKSHQ